jgi:hypothetical protein
MGIETKSFGTLLDELITTDLKCYMAQETVMHSIDEHEVAEASKKAQVLNKRRNELIIAIDKMKGDLNSPTEKTY